MSDPQTPIFIQLHQEKYYSVFFLALGFDMAIALDTAIAMAVAKASSLL